MPLYTDRLMPQTTRREALKALGAGAAASYLFQGCSSAPSYPKPNVLFVMTDDQQHDQMSCAGHPILRTPNMDRLAEGGARFANAFCTNSLCAPGRATVLTGYLSNIHGIRGNSEFADQVEELDDSLPTFPKVLQQNGYRTALMGKWHIRQDPRGFDEWKILPGQGLYNDPDFLHNGEKRQERGYATDVTTDFALDFLRKSGASEQPWCLVYQHKAPHRPFTPAERHAKMFEDIDWPKPATYDDDYATRRIAKEAEDMRFDVSLAGDYPDLPKNLSGEAKRDWIFNRFVKDHFRATYGVDENLGRVLDFLDQTGQAEDTLIVYTTDNGFFLGEHGWYDKRFMYEPSLPDSVADPLPASLQGRASTRRVRDEYRLGATILDAVGIAVPEQMQGRSWFPYWREAAFQLRDAVYYSYYETCGRFETKRRRR